MALNYAEQWSPELLEILMQGTLTSPFVTSNVRWLDAKTFHFTQMSTSGYKNHSREGGWNKGTYTQTDVPYTLTHDRDVEFMVDKADVDETNATASIQNISRIFEQTWVVPETDALFFSKVAQAAQKTEGYHGSTAASAYTKAKVFGMLKDILAKGKLRRYKANGTLIMYVTSQIMDALEQSTEFTRKIEMTQIAEGGMGIETRVTEIDGVPIMEVIDDERFYDAFDWEPEGGGFAPLKKVEAAIIRGRVFRRIRRQTLRAWNDYESRGYVPWWRACRICAYKGPVEHSNSENFKKKYNFMKLLKICSKSASKRGKDIEREKRMLLIAAASY